jgi:hypothetical protein
MRERSRKPPKAEIRAWLLLKAEDEGVDAVRRLAAYQQWRPDWSIKRIDRIHLGESRRFGRFAPAEEAEFDLFVALKARNRNILVNRAFPTVTEAAHKEEVGGRRPMLKMVRPKGRRRPPRPRHAHGYNVWSIDDVNTH